MTKPLHDQSLTELSTALRNKQLSAVEVAQHFLARVKADTTGSFLALNEEATLQQAKPLMRVWLLAQAGVWKACPSRTKMCL